MHMYTTCVCLYISPRLYTTCVCTVAVCLLLQLDPEMSAEVAIQTLKDLRGPGAIQSIKVTTICLL